MLKGIFASVMLFTMSLFCFAEDNPERVPLSEGKSQANTAASLSFAKKPASILETSDILAYYGHPLSARMGILGRLPIDEVYRQLSVEAENYRALSDDRDIKKAFYIIFGTVQPEGKINRIDKIVLEAVTGKDVLLQWIDYAAERDMIVFLDHQIGRYDPVESLKEMLPYLKYPNVHLALDPEWRTTTPNKNIGRVTADEINRAQAVMEQYLVSNNLPGERLLVLHQFKPWMIDETKIDAATGQPITVDTESFSHVRLVHCADGWGNPAQKRGTYALNAASGPKIPVKGFKLFYKHGNQYDEPLLSPADVYALNPRPRVIMYQ
ncbi:MAG: hypothetical protein LBT00_12660 [Spirochaetaceae bacterium]|nr:hypothetical protein [Spirochaetaceae bacterium]